MNLNIINPFQLEQIHQPLPPVQTFLKPGDAKEALEKQHAKLRSRNFQITITCTILVGVIVLTTCIVVAVLGCQSIPIITNELGKRVIAPGFRSLSTVYVLIGGLGSTLGTFGFALATLGILSCVTGRKDRRNRDFETRLNALPDARLNHAMTAELVNHADDATLNVIIPKMDFNQLNVAYANLKKRRFRKLLMQNQTDTIQHRAWLNIISLSDARGSNQLSADAKIKYQSIATHSKLIPEYQKVAFQVLRKERNGCNLLLAKALVPVTDNLPEECSVPIKLTRNGITVVQLELSKHTLIRYSNFMEAALEGLERGETLELEVDDVEAFKEMMHCLSSSQTARHYSPSMTRRIFRCANKYMDRFADALRESLDDSSLRKLIPASRELTQYLARRTQFEAAA